MKKLLSLILVIMMLLTIPVFSYAEDTSKVVKISVPEMITFTEKKAYDSFVTFDVFIENWKQYSKISIITDYNENLFTGVYRHYPAIGGVKPIVVSDSDNNGRRVCSLNPPEVAEYYDVKDYCFDIVFDVVAIGLHNITFNVEAYDLAGNKVDVDLQIDNEIYPEVITAEAAGVYTLDALEIKSGRVYENCGTIVRDIKNKLNSDNFRIRDKNGNILTSDDIISNGDKIEILYEDMVAYSTSICISYDVDCDGKITAADARLALRCSAQLEPFSENLYLAADVDGKSGVNAADARLILRKAAQLD